MDSVLSFSSILFMKRKNIFIVWGTVVWLIIIALIVFLFKKNTRTSTEETSTYIQKCQYLLNKDTSGYTNKDREILDECLTTAEPFNAPANFVQLKSALRDKNYVWEQEKYKQYLLKIKDLHLPVCDWFEKIKEAPVKIKDISTIVDPKNCTYTEKKTRPSSGFWSENDGSLFSYYKEKIVECWNNKIFASRKSDFDMANTLDCTLMDLNKVDIDNYDSDDYFDNYWDWRSDTETTIIWCNYLPDDYPNKIWIERAFSKWLLSRTINTMFYFFTLSDLYCGDDCIDAFDATIDNGRERWSRTDGKNYVVAWLRKWSNNILYNINDQVYDAWDDMIYWMLDSEYNSGNKIKSANSYWMFWWISNNMITFKRIADFTIDENVPSDGPNANYTLEECKVPL